VAQQAGRQKQDRTHQGKERSDADAHQPERQRQQPDQGREDQRQQRQRPAQHEQNAPADKEDQHFHGISVFKFSRDASTPVKIRRHRLFVCPFVRALFRWL